MTQIQALPQIVVAFTAATNEDWLDSLAFTNADGSAIVLTGIQFDMMVRQAAGSADVILSASSSALINNLPPSGTLTVGGTGSNVLGLNIPLAAVQRVNALDKPCVFDVLARGDGVTRRFMTGTVTFAQGVTR